MAKTMDLKEALSDVEEFADDIEGLIESAMDDLKEAKNSESIEEVMDYLNAIESHLNDAIYKLK